MSIRHGTSQVEALSSCPDQEGVVVQMQSYAGVDWASDKHDVFVADAAGEKLLAATFAHDEPGVRSLCRALLRLNVALVAIERPDGLLVERLLDAGLRVLALRPAPARARERAPDLEVYSRVSDSQDRTKLGRAFDELMAGAVPAEHTRPPPRSPSPSSKTTWPVSIPTRPSRPGTTVVPSRGFTPPGRADSVSTLRHDVRSP